VGSREALKGRFEGGRIVNPLWIAGVTALLLLSATLKMSDTRSSQSSTFSCDQFFASASSAEEAASESEEESEESSV
jgi:hypothetical protein